MTLGTTVGRVPTISPVLLGNNRDFIFDPDGRGPPLFQDIIIHLDRTIQNFGELKKHYGPGDTGRSGRIRTHGPLRKRKGVPDKRTGAIRSRRINEFIVAAAAGLRKRTECSAGSKY